MKFKSLRFRQQGAIGILQLHRPAKRNALSDAMVAELDAFFSALPAGVKAVVLHGAGGHFCAGLDLAELSDRSAAQGMAHSRGWHRTFERIQFGEVPVVAVLHGAVVGGGLELASSAHIRVAESSAFYALPEGQRGIFVGGGASVRVPRLIGAARMADLMFTGRVYSAEEGQASGISTYLVPAGKGLAKGIELARRVASNAPATN
ncbi:MAG: crotonase/enoyl-CoA hydratase family protein, partial [Pseudolabrys sp.]